MSRVPQVQDVVSSPASLATPHLRLWQQPIALGGAFTHSTDSQLVPRQQTDETLLSPPHNDRGRLFRAFSMPPPSQLGHLNRPHHRSLSSRDSPPVSTQSAPTSPSTELAQELADSVQMVIQTLLQISPPHLLDPAKEQFSACALQIPTPSISALLTSMKNLNYMSKHMSSLLSPFVETPTHNSAAQDEFDIGEMLQSVGDALSGIAAEAGVELVIFHGDVTMKHVAVRGDECGISYSLSHIIRQVISVANTRDVVEIGLQLLAPHGSLPDPLASNSPQVPENGPLTGIFEVVHKPCTTEGETETPTPNFQMKTLQRLLSYINGRLDPVTTTCGASSYRLSLQLQRGFPVLEPKIISEEDESTRQPFPNLRLAREPTLEELTFFAEKLKGLKATFYASSESSFAHHLTSYLTAWGMDVSHIPTDGCPIQVDTPPSKSHPSCPEREGPMLPNSSDAGPQDQPVSALPANGTLPSCCPSFIIIDDDVAALQARLLETRMQTLSTPAPVRIKRPRLVPGQRTRSTPSVPRAPIRTAPTDPLVILHFTSLANFKVVKDIMQASFLWSTPSMDVLPEVIVVPKPAGPRRFLTALYTAVTKPLVDPFFHPIATSPMSPAGQAALPFFAPNGTSSTPGESTTPNNDKPVTEPSTSPTMAENLSNQQPQQPPAASLLAFDDLEYFSKAAKPFGGSASSGLLIQSPDGRPAGIFFDAQPKPLSRSGSTSRPNDKEGGIKVAAERRKSTVPRAISGEIPLKVGDTLASLPKTRAPLLRMSTPEINQAKGKAAETRAVVSSTNGSAAPGVTVSMIPPGSEQGRERTGEGREKSGRGSLPPNGLGNDTTVVASSPHGASPSVLPRVSSTRRSTDQKAGVPTRKSKKGSEIVPPISVLIVEDNPIEQAVLKTFMQRKKISYAVASNGQEAVEKWQTGNYHLVLMDIQMPIMDGIQATKEIRRLEEADHKSFALVTPRSESGYSPPSSVSVESRPAITPFHSSVIIVALTASTLQSDRVAALAAGCNDFLTKPVTLVWLEKKIIEWGSIKALQMWADPDISPVFKEGQAAQTRAIAENLRIPERIRPEKSLQPHINPA